MASAAPAYLPRQRTAAVDDVQSKELGLAVFSHLVGALDLDDAATVKEPLELLAELLSELPVKGLFEEWSPPMAPFDKAHAIASSECSSSTEYSTAHAAGNAVAEGATSEWRGSNGTKDNTYTVTLRRAVPAATALALEWKNPPEKYSVLVRAGEHAGLPNDATPEAEARWKPLVSDVLVRGKALKHRIPLNGASISGVQIKMTGFGEKSPEMGGESYHGISLLSLRVPDGDKVHTSMATTLGDMLSMLSTCAGCKDEAVAGTALRGLLAHTRSSGSVQSLLASVRALVRYYGDKPLPAPAQAFARQFLDDLDVAVNEEIEMGMSGGATKAGPVQAKFDSSCKSSGINVTDDGAKVSSTSSSSHYVYVDVGFKKGKAAWEFKADRDTRSDECVCYGCGTKPVHSGDYNNSRNLFVVRGYNGAIYHGGRQTRTVSKIHEQQLVRFELDCDTREVVLFLDGATQGVVFNMPEGEEIFPVICTYSSGRQVSLVKVECESVAVGEGAKMLSEMEDGVERSGGASTGGKHSDELDIKVGGESSTHSVALQPDTEGGDETSLKYELETTEEGGPRFETFVGRVAVDDRTPDNARAAVLEVVADDEVVYTSPPMRAAGATRFFRVFVKEATSLTLRSRMAAEGGEGSADEGPAAHLVVLDGHLCEKRDWSWTTISGSDVKPDLAAATATGGELARATLDCAANFAAVQTRISPSPAAGVTPYDCECEDLVALEAPFCLDVSADTFTQLHDALAAVLPLSLAEIKAAGGAGGAAAAAGGAGADAASTGPNTKMAVNLLHLVRGNLRRLAASQADPAELGIELTVSESDAKAGKKPTLAPIHDTLQTLMQDGSEHAKAVQVAAAAAVDAGLTLLYPTAKERRDLLTSLIKQGGVIEVQFRFPTEVMLSAEEIAKKAKEKAKKKDGDADKDADAKQYDLRFERALLLLQVECEAMEWPCHVDGRWGGYMHLVIGIPTEASGGAGAAATSGTAVDFLDSGFGIIMRKAGFESWTFPSGCDSPNIGLKIERYLNFSPAERTWKGGEAADTGGVVRIYPRSAGTYDQVCAEVTKFLANLKIKTEEDED